MDVSLFVCFLIASFPQAAPSADLDVTVTVWDVAGVERRREICSTGIPLPCGLLKEPAGIAVYDAAGAPVPAQFRVLERWRDAGEGRGDGSIRWLLVTFPADVPQGGQAQYRLKRGRNPPPDNPVKIADSGKSWRVGDLEIRKDFSAPFRLILTDAEGRERSTDGQRIEWSVWEEGPLRACLRAESPTDHSRFGFIAWIYAYAESSGDADRMHRCDLTVVLKNTPHDLIGPFYFRDFSVVWEPPGPADARDYALGGEWGRPVKGTFGTGGTAYLHQESDGTDLWETFGKGGIMSPVLDWTADKSRCRAGRPAFRGYKVVDGDKEVAAGDFAAGWAVLNSAKGGAFAALRNYYEQYPKVTEVSHGRITLRLWPRHTRSFGGLHWLDDMTRKAHDLSFRWSAGPIPVERAEAMGKAFDYPLVACASRDWNLAAGAFTRAPRRDTPRPFAGGAVRKQAGSGRNWVTFGGDVADRIRRRYHGADLTEWAQTGDPHQACRLYAVSRHSSGLTPLWLEDYRYPRDAKLLNHAQYCSTVRGTGKYREGTWHHGYMSWNHAHFCAQEIFDCWRIFGDPLALEAVAGIATFCQSYVDFREGGGGLVAGTRADGLPLHNLAEAYRILGGESLLRSLDRFAGVCWKQVNKARGNYGEMNGWEGGKEVVEKPFMMAQVMQGLKAHYELTGSERTRDQMLGMADFILAESSMGPWGFHYVVFIDPRINAARIAQARRKLDDDPKPEGQKNLSYGNLSWVMAWAYKNSGEERFRRAVDGLSSKAYPHVPWAYVNYYAERSDRTPPEAVRDLAAESIGGGKVRLTWTAPAGGPVEYQVKWAEREIAERLKFPEELEAKANWWASFQIHGEPKPSAAGTRESFVVEGISPGTRFFAVRSWDGSRNRSPISNVARVEVR